jgi:hypothetical protein
MALRQREPSFQMMSREWFVYRGLGLVGSAAGCTLDQSADSPSEIGSRSQPQWPPGGLCQLGPRRSRSTFSDSQRHLTLVNSLKLATDIHVLRWISCASVVSKR